jgi:hypothetical protein
MSRSTTGLGRTQSRDVVPNLDSLSPTEIRTLAAGWPAVAPGVRGDVVVRPAAKTIFINIIAAGRPGSGLVGRYLDSLPTDYTIIVPSVMSHRFAGMLSRRGFTQNSPGSWTRRPKTA